MEVWDYVVMLGLVGLTCAVGLYRAFGWRAVRTEDFLVTDRKLSTFSLLMSMVATMTNAANISGYIAEVYTQGIIFFLFTVFVLLGVAVFAWLYLPVYYGLNTHSIYEYLELRFCSNLRVGFSVLQSVVMLLMASCFLYAVSLVLNQVSSLHVWASVWLIGGVCTLYTSLGGFKAVVWSDVAQQLVIYATLILLLLRGLVNVGGVGVVWDRLEKSGRSNVFTWTPDPNSLYSFWTFAIGNSMVNISYFAINQPLIQRCLSNSSLTRAKICVVAGGLGFSICFTMIVACAAILTALYHDCDPLMMGAVKTRDQMLTLFAMETLSPYKGLTGVFVAGLICATISTLSSILNSLAAVTMADYIRPWKPNLTFKVTLTLSKVITFAYGFACVGLVGVIQNAGGIIKVVFGVQCLLMGPTFAIFTVGMLLPWVTTSAALIGVLASTVLPCWVIIGQYLSPEVVPHLPFSVSACANQSDVIFDSSQMSLLQQFYSLSPLWFISWTLLVSLTISLVAGKLIGFQEPSKVNPALLFPVVRRFVKAGHVSTEPELKSLTL